MVLFRSVFIGLRNFFRMTQMSVNGIHELLRVRCVDLLVFSSRPVFKTESFRLVHLTVRDGVERMCESVFDFRKEVSVSVYLGV